MRKRRWIVGGGVAAIAVVGWYLFRPELLFLNDVVAEAFPTTAERSQGEAAPSVLASGRFHSVAHEGKGLATIYQLGDGKRVLRLTEFETSNGPAVYVYLVAAKDAHDSRTVSDAETINLGALKGNIGAQNYDLPPKIDLTRFQAVTIWCRRFSVNFATAPLMPPTDQQSAVGDSGKVHGQM